MEKQFYQDTKDIKSPLIVYGAAKLVAGCIILIFTITALIEMKDILKELFKPRQFVLYKFYSYAILTGAAIILCWLVWSIKSIIMGIKQFGKLILSPEMPPKFAKLNSVWDSLTKRTMSVYSIPSSGPIATARKFFSDKIPFMTRKLREIVGDNISYVKKTIFIIVLILIILFLKDIFINDIFRNQFVPKDFLNFPTFFILLILAISSLKIWSIFSLLPISKPKAEVDESINIIKGGGDPHLFPLEVEKSLTTLRNDSIPNWISKSGFDESEGEIKDTGKFQGKIFIENQPQYVESKINPVVFVFLIVGAFLIVWGAILLINIPKPNQLADNIAGPFALASYFWSLFIGMVIAKSGIGFLKHAYFILASFNYHSIIIILDITGTVGKSEVKAGKAIHDSFESSNTIIKSDFQIKAYCTKLLSENYTLEGQRDIIGMIVDEDSTYASKIIEETVEQFQKKGASIRKIDIESEGLAEMAKANLIYQQQSQKGLTGEDYFDRKLDYKEKKRIEDGSKLGPSSTQIENETKECPDCAEIIKAKARKCRYCGYIFE